jgi:hypothetical protein
MRGRRHRRQRLQRSARLELLAHGAGGLAVAADGDVDLSALVEHAQHVELLDPRFTLHFHQLDTARLEPIGRHDRSSSRCPPTSNMRSSNHGGVTVHRATTTVTSAPQRLTDRHL